MQLRLDAVSKKLLDLLRRETRLAEENPRFIYRPRVAARDTYSLPRILLAVNLRLGSFYIVFVICVLQSYDDLVTRYHARTSSSSRCTRSTLKGSTTKRAGTSRLGSGVTLLHPMLRRKLSNSPCLSRLWSSSATDSFAHCKKSFRSSPEAIRFNSRQTPNKCPSCSSRATDQFTRPSIWTVTGSCFGKVITSHTSRRQLTYGEYTLLASLQVSGVPKC